MRDRRMDRFIVLPFSIGCVSQSSVAVIDHDRHPKRAQTEAAAASTLSSCGDAQRQASGRTKINISAGFQKLIKSFKNLSQLFVIYEEDDDEEIEMEIGLPTDVKHIGHIGWDGFNAMKSLDKAPEFIPLPSFSLKQFDLAMAAQAGALPSFGGFQCREV